MCLPPNPPEDAAIADPTAVQKMLIWAGSPVTNNRNAFDFKANWNIDDEPHLSFILQHEFDNSNKGSGVIMNSHYENEHHVGVVNDLDAFNMHEFNILDGGKTALACTYKGQEVSLADFDRPEETSWVIIGGIVELDVETADILFEWDSNEQISISESVKFRSGDHPVGPPGYDYVHINAVDKNAAGDYIISMRFTNTIYMISGEDGHIMWRLGGSASDFEQDFTFSKQHDVKFIESNGTHHVISLMNNGSDENESDEEVSSALFVKLDTGVTPMTARTITRIERPDGGLTRLRGNVQSLPNGNAFVGWSQWGYHSEHAPNGDFLMSARFVSERFSSYRSYKFDWVGRPAAPPNLVASAYGANDEDLMTIIHVSWNGATDVAGYNFYARAYDRGEDVFIGHTNKTSFETMYISDGFLDWITAEAVDRDGHVMSKSEMQRTDTPNNWAAVGFEGPSTDPIPDDPSLISSYKQRVGSANGDGTSSFGSDRQKSIYADAKEVSKAVYKAYGVIRVMGDTLIFLLAACCVGGVVGGVWYFMRRRKLRSYQHVPSEESHPAEEIQLRSNVDD